MILVAQSLSALSWCDILQQLRETAFQTRWRCTAWLRNLMLASMLQNNETPGNRASKTSKTPGLLQVRFSPISSWFSLILTFWRYWCAAQVLILLKDLLTEIWLFLKENLAWSNVVRSQNNPRKPALSTVLPFGKVFPFLEQEGGDVAVLFLEFQHDKPEQPSQLVQQDVWWQASHQPRGETPCRLCWLAKDACLYWSSKVTAEKTKRAHPIKHLYLSCKPALRCGLDRKCCYGLRRVGGGHWWRQRRSGQQNDEMNALPRSDASNEWE